MPAYNRTQPLGPTGIVTDLGRPILEERHLEWLAARSVSPEVIVRRGYETVDTPRALWRYGFTPGQAAKQPMPGLVIPAYSIDGRKDWGQYRPDDPGESPKYVLPAGSRTRLNIFPAQLGRIKSGETVFVSMEGAVKADALISQGCLAVSVDGVYGWSGTTRPTPLHGMKHLIKELAAHDRTPRFVLVADSDFAENPDVRRAVCQLATRLQRVKAQVRVVYPPSGPNGSKLGVDDFLAAGGALSDLRIASRSEVAAYGKGTPGRRTTIPMDLAA